MNDELIIRKKRLMQIRDYLEDKQKQKNIAISAMREQELLDFIFRYDTTEEKAIEAYKSMKEKIMNKCIHFNGIQNKECKIGIKYEDVMDYSARPFRFPCLINSLNDGGDCDHVSFPTEEEAQKKADEIDKTVVNSVKIYAAIKDHHKKTKEFNGIIECPICKGELYFALIAPNRHIRGECKGCGISVIE